MKKQVTIILSLTLAILLIPGVINAQNTSKEQEKKEQEIRKMEMKKQQEEQEKLIEELAQAKSSGRAGRVEVVTGESAFGKAQEAYVNAMDNLDNIYITSAGGDTKFAYFGSQNSTSLTYSKYVTEATFSKVFSADVDPESRRASISVSGSSKEGEIRIRITMPSGKVYSEVLIDEYGSVNWNKTFTLDEDGKDDKAGTWHFTIEGKNATGNFKLSVRSN